MARNALKLPWMQFCPGDWLKDPQLSMCEPATRGIWIDLIAAMHQLDRQGVIAGTREQIARTCRCSTVQLDSALSDLQTTGTADVTVRNNIVTVVNRRMKREANTRYSTKLRVGRYREKVACNAVDTPDISEIRDQKVRTTNQPPTLSDVLARAEIIGCSKEQAERFWHHFTASGWIDKNGHPIVDWGSKLCTWTSNTRAAPFEQAHKASEANGSDYWKDSNQLKQVDEELRVIESRASHTAMDLVIEPRDMANYTRLRARRKELKRKLGLQ